MEVRKWVIKWLTTSEWNSWICLYFFETVQMFSRVQTLFGYEEPLGAVPGDRRNLLSEWWNQWKDQLLGDSSYRSPAISTPLKCLARTNIIPTKEMSWVRPDVNAGVSNVSISISALTRCLTRFDCRHYFILLLPCPPFFHPRHPGN